MANVVTNDMSIVLGGTRDRGWSPAERASAKGQEVVDANFTVVRAAYDLARERYGADFPFNLEAIRRMGCVFSALKRQLEPSQQRELAAALPEEVDTWFLSA